MALTLRVDSALSFRKTAGADPPVTHPKLTARGWLLALVGPVGCLVLCEICKLLTAAQMRAYQRTLAEKHGAEDARLAAAAAARQVVCVWVPLAGRFRGVAL